MKVCNRCGEEKPLGCFRNWKGKEGGCGYCKDCARDGYPDSMMKLFRKQRRREFDYFVQRFGKAHMNDVAEELRNRGYRGSLRHMAVQLYIFEKGMKRCPSCKKYKPVGEFAKDVRCFNGYGYCKRCKSRKKREAYQMKKKKREAVSSKMEEIKKLADKCKELRIQKILSGC